MSFNDKIREQHLIPWTFKTWILKFIEVDLPIGDLARDISNDNDFPDSESFSEMFEYLQRIHASGDAMDAFVTVWNFYLSSNAIPDGFFTQ